jgi:predicted component of type VI protein secretion system
VSDENKPAGGIHLGLGFGERSAVAPATRASADVTVRLVIIGDFGGGGDAKLRDISGEDVSSLLGGFGAAVAIEVPNHFGSAPPTMAVRLAIASLRDLDPKTIAARVPEIVRAERVAAAFTDKKSAAEFEALASDPGLDRVVAALRHATPAAAVPTPRDNELTPPADDSIDRLLGMVDMPGAPSESDAAKAAVSAFLSSMARPHAAAISEPMPAVKRLVQAQLREIVTHERWLAVEAVWRAMRLLYTARAARVATRLVLCDISRDATADLLESPAFADALTSHATAHEADVTVILVLGALGRSTKDLDRLDRIAKAAEGLRAPTIVSLAHDFFGVPPEQVAKMDNPVSLLETPGYAAWRGLRGRAESRFLFTAWNDFVLRPAGDETPVLWGEPGVLLAAQVMRSAVRLGWPTEILGTETAIGDLDLTEVDMSNGRKTAIPLRALISAGIARDLAAAGITCPVCRPDRDQAWFTRASALYELSAASDANRMAMEAFNGLPFHLISTYFENLLQKNSALYAGASNPDAAAASIARLLDDVLLTTGPDASVQVTPNSEDRCYAVTIRLGRSVMDGFSFSFEIGV